MLTARGYKARNVVAVEAIDALEVSATSVSQSPIQVHYNLQLSSPPLHLLDDVQAAVYDKLVHIPRLFWEARNAIAALLRTPKLIFEQRVIQCANNREIEGHDRSVLYWARGKGRGLVVRRIATRMSGIA